MLSFEAEVLEGELGLSDETTDFGCFSLKKWNPCPCMASHKARVEDALLGGEALIK
ncbi:MAG: hypothetical protein IPO22_02195 [Anaerolineales bacterium]|nr:hypothetical protein [Anaerolineales bacterium]